jgi:ATP-dependent RNA helicase CshB
MATTETSKLSSTSCPIGSFNLKKEVVDILKANGFQEFSPIQAAGIPKMLKGLSLLGLAPTGTGKTLTYVLPIVNDLTNDGHVQAVILCPTVGLLEQVRSVFKMFLDPLGFPEDSLKLIQANSDISHSKPDVILTTPNFYETLRSHYPVNELKRVVLDEGDMIAFDGFSSFLGALKGAVSQHQVSFFSASLSSQDIKKVKKTFQIAVLADVRDKQIANTTVSHHLINYRGLEIKEALVDFLRQKQDILKAIVFVSKKEEIYPLAAYLTEKKIPFLELYGDMEKREITRNLHAFNAEKEGLLVASDYAARGIDISDVQAVISLNLPSDLDYYFHRAGRTGRFLEKGDSYLFFSEDDAKEVQSVKDLIRRGVSFDMAILSANSLRMGKQKYEFHNLGKKDQSNDLLQKQIRHVVNQTRSKRVKPNYKKKVKRAVEMVKEKHRMKVVLTNIARAGGDVKDFHMDDDYRGGRKDKFHH